MCFIFNKRNENSLVKQFRIFRFLSIVELIQTRMDKRQLNVVFLHFAYCLIYLFCLQVLHSYPMLTYYLMDDKDFKVSILVLLFSIVKLVFLKNFIRSLQFGKIVSIWKQRLDFVFKCYNLYTRISHLSISYKIQCHHDKYTI